jgi:quinol monooxygenase YgiN
MQPEELYDIRWIDIDDIGAYSKNPKMLALIEKIKKLS